MATSVHYFLVLFVGVWAMLLNLGNRSWAVFAASLALVAVHVTDWIMKAIQNTLPRKSIKYVDDKAVFITGCDSGFGFELALRLDKAGYKVYAGCLSPDGAGALTLKAECSSLLTVLPLDVTKDEDVKAAFMVVQGTLGDRVLWSVVNNAGIAAMSEIEWCPLASYQRCLDVNTLGPIRVTKIFLPLVRKAEGRIVVVASLAGRYTFPGFSAYAMSKHAAVSFADALRLEMRKFNVSVHTIEPTLYRTNITSVTALQNSLEEVWESCPEDIKETYGQDYMKDFRDRIEANTRRAKPSHKIVEVIDDMFDAVTGVDPKMRYVPSMVTQVRAKIMSTLPMEFLDNFLLTNQPSTPPATVQAKHSAKRKLQTPTGPRGETLQRHLSMPNWEKSPLTPSPKVSNAQKFSFAPMVEE
ncbi:17-beta-hydroxysteroid dehydrogenase type 6-like [Oratosquilla oratoria]|uniref:17-beta-hydroxysteroid dehydrogenase type 6-like n=1 Tax=Oratosquilla oratoria TaxID=337810 RepID=UPI003F7666C1